MPHSTETETQQGDFPGIPPFPTDIPTAPLLHINLKKLIEGDKDEIQRLGQASSEIGFFLLDLRGIRSVGDEQEDYASNKHSKGDVQINGSFTPPFDGDTFLEISEELFHRSAKFFELPQEEKDKYNFQKDKVYVGYKGLGGGYVDRTGKKDRNEMWDMSKDDIVGNKEPMPAPDFITSTEMSELYKKWTHNAHALTLVIMNSLESYLGLPSNTLNKLHRLEERSDEKIRVMRAPPQDPKDLDTALGAHADSGSITVLFNKAGGLQVYPPEHLKGINTDKQEWLYVRPAPGHCIINIGNALVALTAGILRSNLHRVLPPPGEQVSVCRYSLVYFGRPEKDVQLEPQVASKMIAEAQEKNGDVEGGQTMGDKYMGMVQKRRL